MHVYEVSDFCVYFTMVDVNITIPKYPISIDNNSMKQKIKRYNITLRDHVQLLGYRGQIELIGKDLGLHGIVFNAPDGSVKVVAEGEEGVFDVFFDDLKRIREGVGIETKEVSRDADLPIPFSRVATDETLEYMKRFDKGIDLLTDIKSDNRELLSNTNLLVKGQDKLVETQDKLVEGQNQTNKGQNKVIALLEKIESKLK
jgi:acylphosphatase